MVGQARSLQLEVFNLLIQPLNHILRIGELAVELAPQVQQAGDLRKLLLLFCGEAGCKLMLVGQLLRKALYFKPKLLNCLLLLDSSKVLLSYLLLHLACVGCFLQFFLLKHALQAGHHFLVPLLVPAFLSQNSLQALFELPNSARVLQVKSFQIQRLFIQPTQSVPGSRPTIPPIN